MLVDSKNLWNKSEDLCQVSFLVCIECCSTIFLFTSSSSNKIVLTCCIDPDSNIKQWNDVENDHSCSLSLKPSPNLVLLANQVNNANSENSNDLNIMTMRKCITLKYFTKILS